MMKCIHHSDYDPMDGEEPTGTCHQLLNGCIQPHIIHSDPRENDHAFPCPYCWQMFGRLGWARLDHLEGEYKRILKRMEEKRRKNE